MIKGKIPNTYENLYFPSDTQYQPRIESNIANEL